MSEQTWRPFGIESEDEVAEYDALHDGVPIWMQAAFWVWVRKAIAVYCIYPDRSGRVEMLQVEFTEEMCQRLRIPFKNVRSTMVDYSTGQGQLSEAMTVLRAHGSPLQIADYLLALGNSVEPEVLHQLLERNKSAWAIAERAGRPGLVRRVPLGVQVAADDVMNRTALAGVRLSKAWEALYGLSPDASTAYSLAIKAVEDVTIPLVTPADTIATLGKVIKVIEDQGDWKLPLTREHTKALPTDVLVGMMRMLWHGQHDRHGGQPSAPGNVSLDEAAVAVGLAVTLVSWFDAGLVTRATP